MREISYESERIMVADGKHEKTNKEPERDEPNHDDRSRGLSGPKTRKAKHHRMMYNAKLDIALQAIIDDLRLATRA